MAITAVALAKKVISKMRIQFEKQYVLLRFTTSIVDYIRAVCYFSMRYIFHFLHSVMCQSLKMSKHNSAVKKNPDVIDKKKLFFNPNALKLGW